MNFFRKIKESGEFDEKQRKYELEILKNLPEIDKLKQSLEELKNKLEEKDKEIKKLNSKIDLLKSSPIESVSDVNFIGDDEGVGTYLKNVEVYSEIDLYNIGFIHDFPGRKTKVCSKNGEKGSVTISLKVSSGCSSKKDVFNAIKKAYPKLLEYFRQ
ncbi:TPA: hypothetical protein K8N12_001631 [Clostridium perfringens]|nr:hypothetical protein [Clostridium perfringens]